MPSPRLPACHPHNFVRTFRRSFDGACEYEVDRCTRCGAWESNMVDHAQGFLIAPPEESSKYKRQAAARAQRMREGRATGRYQPR